MNNTYSAILFVNQLEVNGPYRIVPWSFVGNDLASIEDRKQFEQTQVRIRQTLKMLLPEQESKGKAK